MTEEERAKLKEYVNRWRETGKFLEKLKLEEFRHASLAETILSLSDASESALIHYPPKPTSGLIEMQKILRKIKK